MMAGVNLIHVPYRLGPALYTDLLSGQIQVAFSAMPAAIEFIRTGRLRAIAVTSETRSEVLPDTPAIAEFLPGYEASVFLGVSAPKTTPTEVIINLNTEVNKALADPNMKARISELSGVPMPMAPSEFGKLIADETEKWGKVIQATNIKVQ
jgi:tripartite-type tricarboxylate transporter receptor subunit TctC